jgi:hypothetical protein
MGQIRLPAPVWLILALSYKSNEEAEQALHWFEEKAGPVADRSEIIRFDHTHYYDEEMGSDLNKRFYAFLHPIDPADLASFKLFSNEIEDRLSQEGRRHVNLDPGYLEAAKLILATTKNFSHRIYLAQGIYGDVQLFWRHGCFQFNPWTYPDYKDDRVLLFFTRIRGAYLQNRGETSWPLPTNPLA